MTNTRRGFFATVVARFIPSSTNEDLADVYESFYGGPQFLEFDQLSAATLTELRRDAIPDTFFVSDAFSRSIYCDGLSGGSFIHEPLAYLEDDDA